MSNKRVLIAFTDFGMDGMRCDINGNLYIARFGKGTVVKVSPEGKIIKEVTLTGITLGPKHQFYHRCETAA